MVLITAQPIWLSFTASYASRKGLSVFKGKIPLQPQEQLPLKINYQPGPRLPILSRGVAASYLYKVVKSGRLFDKKSTDEHNQIKLPLNDVEALQHSHIHHNCNSFPSVV